MCSLRALALATVTVAAFSVLQASAGPGLAPPGLETTEARIHKFSTCAGRLRALMEYQWLFQDPASDETEAMLLSYDDLIEALRPDAEAAGISGTDIYNWRVAARMAHRNLLQQANFTKGRRARAARLRLNTQIGGCRQLLLG